MQIKIADLSRFQSCWKFRFWLFWFSIHFAKYTISKQIYNFFPFNRYFNWHFGSYIHFIKGKLIPQQPKKINTMKTIILTFDYLNSVTYMTCDPRKWTIVNNPKVVVSFCFDLFCFVRGLLSPWHCRHGLMRCGIFKQHWKMQKHWKMHPYHLSDRNSGQMSLNFYRHCACLMARIRCWCDECLAFEVYQIYWWLSHLFGKQSNKCRHIAHRVCRRIKTSSYMRFDLFTGLSCMSARTWICVSMWSICSEHLLHVLIRSTYLCVFLFRWVRPALWSRYHRAACVSMSGEEADWNFLFQSANDSLEMYMHKGYT